MLEEMHSRRQRKNVNCHLYLISIFFYEKEGKQMPKLRNCTQNNQVRKKFGAVIVLDQLYLLTW